MHDSVLTTALVTFQFSFFNSDRKHLCLISPFYNCPYRSCFLWTKNSSQKYLFRYPIYIRILLDKECIFIQSKYNLNEENQSFGHELPRNGSGHFTVTGHFQLPWKP